MSKIRAKNNILGLVVLTRDTVFIKCAFDKESEQNPIGSRVDT